MSSVTKAQLEAELAAIRSAKLKLLQGGVASYTTATGTTVTKLSLVDLNNAETDVLGRLEQLSRCGERWGYVERGGTR